MARFTKGDKVRSHDGGPVMEVIACSEHVALCAWQHDGRRQEDAFPVDHLHKQVSQQQQQPQPPPQPGTPD
jgi:uncharacterized protein YodC (DUF2158 family)